METIKKPPENQQRRPAAAQTGPVPAGIGAVPPLNSDRFAAYTLVSTTNERR